ncbi:HFL122Cp [Eremothecium sinecaudum]|uniref:HFL122Cp n=1 Tax=Eremothecium sinecaudum TaxID=45286 RepID=A0A0X8HUI2_9SACH|nr:HFL122Cp [Eremothecium sinecaudum]AMD21734.1 HFL122Cp [Eremothecium sinecaudum]
MLTATEEQRKLIEQLLGKESHKHFKRDLGLHDPKLCKSYIVGECPFELFQGTKQNFGKCPQVHVAKYKLQYQQGLKKGIYYADIEREYYAVLNKFIRDCNGQIEVALKKLEHTPEERAKIMNATSELDIVDSKIGLMIKEIEVLIRSGEVVKAMVQSLKLQTLQKERQELAKKVRDITENVGQSAQQKLQVCKVCGAYLSRLDTDRRLADHFLGKIHLGYVKMRQAIEDLKRRFQERGEDVTQLDYSFAVPTPLLENAQIPGSGSHHARRPTGNAYNRLGGGGYRYNDRYRSSGYRY